ncbi:MAG: OmpA family protein [Bacteroidota bacterium]
MKKQYVILLLCMVAATATAQDSKEFVETSSARHSLRVAQQFINREEFERAERQLVHTVKIKDDFAVAHRELGRVYLELGKYDKAIQALERSFELDDKLSRAAFFECGEAYFQSGQAEQAMFYYQQFKDMKGKRYANKSKESGLELGYEMMLKEREANCQYLASIDTSNVFDWPERLGKTVNSKYDDYLPTITSDGRNLVFTRQGKPRRGEDVLICKKKEGRWGISRRFGPNLNTAKNEGMAKFETHGRAFYFAGCMRQDTEGGCDIYRATLKDGEVDKVARLEGQLNSNYWDSQPAITCDGKSMYFSSSREGGQGGVDLWVSYLKSNGDWGIPQNLGTSINTPGDEEAPFISSDGKTLYFTSNGHQGQGDGDLFISRNVNGHWEKPINMGYPINSPAKELGFYVQGNGRTAYFSSARKGGAGKLDIYEIELPESMRPYPMVHLEGFVRNADSQDPISGTIHIGREGEKWVVKSDEDGWFFICLPGNKGYSFRIEQPGYEGYMEARYLEAQDNVAPVNMVLPLVPLNRPAPKLSSKGPDEVAERRIQFFFGFDSYDLTETTLSDLRALAAMLRKEDWKVEVVGYADPTGNKEYNLRLSENRAEAIVDYLQSAGITINKVIRNEGKGSISSTTDDDGQKSRRVDVILRH